jgi:hypothetical protein
MRAPDTTRRYEAYRDFRWESTGQRINQALLQDEFKQAVHALVWITYHAHLFREKQVAFHVRVCEVSLANGRVFRVFVCV